MSFSRNNIFSLSLAAIALAAVLFFSLPQIHDGNFTNIKNRDQKIRRVNTLQNWKETLRSLLKSNQLRPEDFEKIDFSLPGDPSYGDDPENEFFNPDGKFKAQPITQENIDFWAKEKNTRVVFNIRRHIENKGDGNIRMNGTVIDRLVYFIPNVKESCIEYIPNTNADIIKGIPFETAADNHSIVDDGYYFEGCVRTQNREKVFMFVVLATRYKLPNDENWITR